MEALKAKAEKSHQDDIVKIVAGMKDFEDASIKTAIDTVFDEVILDKIPKGEAQHLVKSVHTGKKGAAAEFDEKRFGEEWDEMCKRDNNWMGTIFRDQMQELTISMMKKKEEKKPEDKKPEASADADGPKA